MANWNTLKTAVANIIKTNGNQAITGLLLQNVLNNIITNVGENATFAGIATLNTNPGAPDGPVFYLASKKGVYPNFNAIEVKEGEVAIIECNNGSWVKTETGLSTKESLNQSIDNVRNDFNDFEKEINERLTSTELEIEKMKLETRTYKLDGFNYTVLRGDIVGTSPISTEKYFSTSEYIKLYDTANRIIYKNTYGVQPENRFAGFVMYNEDKDTIVYVGGGTGEVNLNDYPEAKYFRYCSGDTSDISLCEVNVVNKAEYKSLAELNTELKTIDTRTDNLEEVLSIADKYKFNSFNNQVLKGDSIAVSTYEGFSTSDYIEIKQDVKNIIYTNTYEVQPGNYFAGFVMYNESKDTIIHVGGGTGEIDMLNYPEAKYFRFCSEDIEGCEVKLVSLGLGNETGLTNVRSNVFINTFGKTSDYLSDEQGFVWVGYDKVFEKGGILDEYRIQLNDSSENDIGIEYEFVIGIIDQRNWLLPRLTINKNVSSIEGNFLIFDFSDDIVSIKKNEVIFIKAKKTILGSESSDIVPLHVGNRAILYTNNLYNSLQIYGDTEVYEANIRITIKEIDSYFASKDEQNEIRDRVNAIESISSKKQDSILIDESNGNKYKLSVKDGELLLKLMKYTKVLFIGNSFTIHGKLQGIWECDGRSMAATTDSTMYATLVAERMGIEVDRAGLADNNGMFERVLLDFDFSYLPNKSTNYDAIVIQLGENIIETDSSVIKSAFRNLFEAVKNNWSNSDVYAMFGTIRNSTRAIEEVASEFNIQTINCGDVSLATLYQHKDYYIGSDGAYHELSDAVYRSHPSDIGMYNMAQRVIQAFGGISINDKMFSITLNQTIGGTISTAHNKWVEGGVVTIRCTANSGKSINNVVVSSDGKTIDAVKRIGAYICYTFIMPKSDVTITPEWA